jgi:hydrogenase maturation protein HypF
MTAGTSLSGIDCCIRMPASVPPVLATGAWFKNTLCVTSGQDAFISNTVGNLDSPEACAAHELTARSMLEWLGEKPHAIAHDLHPDFHSSRVAAKLAAELGVPLVAVQHHHAHIASLAAEHGFEQPLLGLALDGIGFGSDGCAWGGELLRVHGAGFERLGHFQSLPMPGGDRAAREPWRMAAAVLHATGRNEEIPRRYAAQPGAVTVAAMLAKNLNCPPTSSAGRMFDAAAGLLGLCETMEFEAQAAIMLEQAAGRHAEAHGLPPALTDGWNIDSSGRLDLLPLLGKLASVTDAEYGAALFHATLIAALADWMKQAAHNTGINTVACGGGCFLNRLLVAGLRKQLTAAGLDVLTAQAMQPGDSAISLGQAWVALNSFSRGI